MNKALDTSSATRPTGLRAFLGGFGSGAKNGALMMGIVFSLAAIASFTPLAAAVPLVLGANFSGFLATAGLTTAATGVFGGVMAATRSPKSRASDHMPRATDNLVAVPVSADAGPAIIPMMDMAADSPAQASGKSWVAQTGRNGDSQGRIDQILANGSMSDRDRASAILAAREASASADMGRN